ncbi:N-acetyltransferase [Paenibacillus albiflavus]|uniref:N-acetyltransferase n=1 Tax=Paenibacillus albiflavus TaxID=2545760 RepID=A0A4R4EEZ6_9BACL|nr:GNAT family N-acetyltransferase [Paenibacillus albiflavus]TCZ78319.1 N-acetyltransferase [Paenibacillus albiflavus]
MEIYRTERLIIRKWLETDSKDLYEYASNELVGPNAGWAPHQDEEESLAVLQMFIENDDAYAVVLKSENKVIGSIGLHDRKPDDNLADLAQGEIGYVLNPAYWGQGIIPEAVNGLIQYGFNEADLDLIWCGHFDFNHNSRRVVEKCGFTYRFQKNSRLERLNNREVTTLYYNITKEEFEASNQ